MSDAGGNPVQLTAHEFSGLTAAPEKLPAFLRVKFQQTLNWEKQERRKKFAIIR